jgi:hypothetical protein
MVLNKFWSRKSVVTVFLVAGLAKSYAQETSPKGVTGRWQVTRPLKEGGEEVSTLELKQSGPNVSGTFTSPNGELTDIQNGKVVDASLTFSFLYADMHLDVSGQILSDNKIDLTITAQGMSETLHATAERRETSSSDGQPLNPLSFLPAPMTREPLTADEKLSVYVHRTFGPPALILPAFGAGLSMLNPPSHYPHEWKDGAQAFERSYGNIVATVTARETASMLAGVALHEDPRYRPSGSTNVLRRVFHALSYTVVDRSDSGKSMVAFSNFAGAAAGGLVGMAYLPNGFNDATHAQQRMATQFATLAIHNLAAEFQPQWGPIVKKLRIPKLLPEWWVPRQSQHP